MADFSRVDSAYETMGATIASLKAAVMTDEQRAAALAAAEAAKVASAEGVATADGAADAAVAELVNALDAVGVAPPAEVVIP